MKSKHSFVILSTVFAVTMAQPLFAKADWQEGDACTAELKLLGEKDPDSLKYFCDGRKIDYKCLEREVDSGRTVDESLPKCSEIGSADSVMVTKTAIATEGASRKIQSSVKVWTGPNIAIAFGVAAALNTEKRCISGPFIDKSGHKVFGHGAGNALGTALIGWATQNCDRGVKSMLLMSAAREQMKISQGYNCEWNSMVWDGVGITAGGELCEWLAKNVTRPKFLQDLSERIFGHNSSITVVPNGAGLNKDF